MKADKLISKSFEKLLERGKARGFITHEELKKSLGKRNSNPESLEKAVLNIFDNLITLVKQKSDFKVKTKEEAPKAEKTSEKLLEKFISKKKSHLSNEIVQFISQYTENLFKYNNRI